jgi:putative ABC transport system permease protein
VVLELAAAVALTIAGALLAKSYVRFQTIDNGFEGDRVLTASVTLPRARYPDEAGRRAFFEKVLERVRAVPSVEAVSVSQVGVGGFTWTMPWPARHTGASTAEQVAVLSDVGHHYFRTFGIRIVAGAECEAGALVPQAVINEQMARRAFPGRSAVGQLLDLGDEGRYSVIGVASDVRNPKTKALPWATVHTCATDIHHNRSGVIAVRARAGVDPMSLSPVIRLAVSQADPSQPVASMLTVSELVRDATTERWFSAGLVAVFAGITFVLAVVGLYSVIAYLVARRTHEIGVRIALGATQADVARLVLAQGGALTIAGLLLGLGAAVPLARLAASMLFEVEVFDLSVFVATTATMVLVSMTAVAVPALRATRVDALVALRTE